MSIAGEWAPGANGALKGDISSIRDPDGPRAGNQANAETFLFNKHYNKELKLCEGSTKFQIQILIIIIILFLNYRWDPNGTLRTEWKCISLP